MDDGPTIDDIDHDFEVADPAEPELADDTWTPDELGDPGELDPHDTRHLAKDGDVDDDGREDTKGVPDDALALIEGRHNSDDSDVNDDGRNDDAEIAEQFADGVSRVSRSEVGDYLPAPG